MQAVLNWCNVSILWPATKSPFAIGYREINTMYEFQLHVYATYNPTIKISDVRNHTEILISPGPVPNQWHNSHVIRSRNISQSLESPIHSRPNLCRSRSYSIIYEKLHKTPTTIGNSTEKKPFKRMKYPSYASFEHILTSTWLSFEHRI